MDEKGNERFCVVTCYAPTLVYYYALYGSGEPFMTYHKAFSSSSLCIFISLPIECSSAQAQAQGSHYRTWIFAKGLADVENTLRNRVKPVPKGNSFSPVCSAPAAR